MNGGKMLQKVEKCGTGMSVCVVALWSLKFEALNFVQNGLNEGVVL